MSLPFDRSAVKNLFRGDGAFCRLVHQFNAHPAGYADPTWFEPYLAGPMLEKVRQTLRGESRLSAILLQQVGLKDNVCYDFEFRRMRFALLPAVVLKKLCLYCGLAFYHRHIASVVMKSSLEAIKKSVGDKAYCFTVKRAPLLVGQIPGTDRIWDGRRDLAEIALQDGAVYLLSHFSRAPAAIGGRLALKFSKSLAGLAVNKSSENGWAFFKRVLLHEIDPAWRRLFL